MLIADRVTHHSPIGMTANNFWVRLAQMACGRVERRGVSPNSCFRAFAFANFSRPPGASHSHQRATSHGSSMWTTDRLAFAGVNTPTCFYKMSKSPLSFSATANSSAFRA
jgi:hypothetical protein